MARRYTFTSCVSFGTDGEADYCELDATVSYEMVWGSAPDPWGDDPGSGDQIDDLRLEAVDDRPFTGSATYAAMILDEIERTCEADMIVSAHEAAGDDAAAAEDYRAEQMREDRHPAKLSAAPGEDDLSNLSTAEGGR